MDKIEKRVLNKLRNGASIITDSDHYGAVISGHGADMEISNPALQRLINKKLIYQQLDWPFHFLLNE